MLDHFISDFVWQWGFLRLKITLRSLLSTNSEHDLYLETSDTNLYLMKADQLTSMSFSVVHNHGYPPLRIQPCARDLAEVFYY